MKIGVPREIKVHEYRVGITPTGVQELTRSGHTVCIEHNAGERIGFSNNDYLAAGATIEKKAEKIWRNSELVVKVKEPQPQEISLLSARQTLFTYLHLAASKKLTLDLLETGCTAIAYETVTDKYGKLPLLAPMSEIAGRMATQAGAHYLEIPQGGRGVLMGGATGVAAANVVVIGAGVVGRNAARVAVGMGAQVTLLDYSVDALRAADIEFNGRVALRIVTDALTRELCRTADLVIGAVLVPGAAAPRILDEDDVKAMRNGSVIVDVSIDQGGCFATSKPTTHAEPVYIRHGVIHYCVANIPGAVARTSTEALTNATLPYVQQLADCGIEKALQENSGLAAGLNIKGEKLYCQPVAETFRLTDRLAITR
jgi:alanine dehydrogenase